MRQTKCPRYTLVHFICAKWKISKIGRTLRSAAKPTFLQVSRDHTSRWNTTTTATTFPNSGLDTAASTKPVPIKTRGKTSAAHHVGVNLRKNMPQRDSGLSRLQAQGN